MRMWIMTMILALAEISVAAVPSEGKVNELVDSFSRAAAWTKQAAVVGKSEYTGTDERESGEARRIVHEFRRFRDGNRIDYRALTYSLDASGQKDLSSELELRKLAMPGASLTYGKEIARPPRSVDFSKLPEEAKTAFDDVSFNENLGTFLDGRVRGSQLGTIDLVSIFEEHVSQTTVREETIGKTACYVLEATVAGVQYRAWLSRDKDFNCVRYEIEHKERQDFTDKDGRPFSSFQKRCDLTEFKQIDGTWVPVQGTLTTTITRQDGSRVVNVISTNRQQVELRPDFDKLGAFLLNDIPDGTRIGAIGEWANTGVEFEWRGGKIVPRFDETLIQRIEEEMRATPERGRPATAPPQAKPAPVPGRIESNPAKPSPPNSTGTKFLGLGIAAAVVVLAVIVAVVIARSRRQTR